MNTNTQAQTEQSQPHAQSYDGPLEVEYFFVTAKKLCGDGCRIVGLPLSPYFRTREEAKTFLASCEVKGAYRSGGSFYPRDEEEAKQDELMLFGSETQPALTGPLCYWIEKPTAQKNPEL